MGVPIRDWGKRARSVVKGVRACALSGGPRNCASAVPFYGRASPIREAPRSALPEEAADAALVHEPRHMRHDSVPFWGQGAVVGRLPRHPRGRARPLELRAFILARQPVCAAASDPPRAGAHERKRYDDATVALHKVRSFHVAVYCLEFIAGGVIFQQSAAVRTDQLLKEKSERLASGL